MITIDELWKIWISSQAYKWSVDDILNWLYNDAVLAKCLDNLRRNKIDGRSIPRLAANQNSFLTKVLKIKDYRDRSRIMLKATDLVLFGHENGNLSFKIKFNKKLKFNFKASFSLSSKDLIFFMVFFLLTSVFGYVYRKNLNAQNEIYTLRKNMTICCMKKI